MRYTNPVNLCDLEGEAYYNHAVNYFSDNYDVDITSKIWFYPNGSPARAVKASGYYRDPTGQKIEIDYGSISLYRTGAIRDFSLRSCSYGITIQGSKYTYSDINTSRFWFIATRERK